ncbi:MAG: BACON domain-containing protein [Bacteroidaceae bacterium]|nr:BACON domain-containing protein [Bacteroidaceae bacterium]
MKKQKFWRFLSLLLMGLSLFTSSMCDPDPEDPKLEVSTHEITLDAEGETQSFTIDSNVSWTITGNKSWLSVSPTMGKKDATVVLTAQQNTNVGNRDCLLTIMSADGGVSQTVKVVQDGAEGELRVNGSTSASLSFGADGGEKQQINITANSDWTITSIPDWIRVSPVNGSKNSTITVTIDKENFSDEDREATLVIEGSGISANLNILQAAKLAKNCRVTLSNKTIMWDGFAADLAFENGAIGYREAFFTENDIKGMTDRDIYNLLMKQYEYDESTDYTFLPGWVDENTKIIYCVAAYGSENNEDGSHKYGPMNKMEITTKEETLYADMYLNLTYTSSRWTVNTSRVGQYGQRCDEYYIFCVEGDYYASYYKDMVSKYTYALFAHLVFKPQIAEDPNDGYKYGPQDINYSRNSDQIFFACWGKDRDSKEFSAELTILHEDLSPDDDENTFVPQYSRVQNDNSSWNKPRRIIPRSEVEKLRKNMKVYKVQL